ncbi:MAG: hypothetical protein PVI03_01535, partial [Candidatus Thorarchaeota archaeon]
MATTYRGSLDAKEGSTFDLASLEDILNAKVSKTGDTMSGQLTVDADFLVFPDKFYVDQSASLITSVADWTITGGLEATSIDNTPIGQTTPAVGTFTEFTSNGINDDASSEQVTINDNTLIIPRLVGISESSGGSAGSLSLKAWGTNSAAIQIGAVGSIYTNESGPYGTFYTDNVYLDSIGNHKRIVADSASMLQLYAGGAKLRVAGSGSADSTITFVDALSISSSGTSDFNGDVYINGAFTSLGIDDNASTTQLTIADSSSTFASDVVMSASSTRYDNGTYGPTFKTSAGAYRSMMILESDDNLRIGNTGAGDGNDSISFNVTGIPDVLVLDSAGDATFAGDVSLGDDQFLYFGNSNDFRAYYDSAGNNAYIQSVLADTIFLENRSDSGLVYIRSEDSVGTVKNGIIVGGTTPDVRLYNDGVQQLKTISNGVTFGTQNSNDHFYTFDVSDGYQAYLRHPRFSGDIIISSNSSGGYKDVARFGGSTPRAILYYDGSEVLKTLDKAIQITSTDSGAGYGPDINLYRSSASPAVGDALGRINFAGKNSSASYVTYGTITSTIDDPTSTSEDAQITIQTRIAGGLGTRVRIASGLYMPGASGGDQGAGTINATGLYVNGVAVTGSGSFRG